ncbi:MAG: CDP-glycerol glycerophosphotransferase family protein, partial [Deltaproteobacteria bacterium]|nr:CDP-glycerol glycerophosphotransferase family protein [Deltaproteobacteria bacterium]
YDIILCYGPYHQKNLEFCKDTIVIQMGYPRMDRFFNERIDTESLKERFGCTPGKPTIVWLPSYRGSTTVYYSLLNDRNCGVSAILLSKNIDEGPLVGRRTYPPPPADVDIDYVYDGVIRSNLLISVLQDYIEKGYFPDIYQQDANEGYTYYVIHPVLKHLAILSLSSE